MKMLLLYCFSALLSQSAVAQTARPIGTILAIDSGARRITIRTDSGPEMIISFETGTRILQVAPDAKDLQNAVPILLSDLAAGDRILARGRAGEGGTFAATSIIVMSRQDLAKKQAAERADWEKRGVGGIIAAVDPALKQITITAAGAQQITMGFSPGAVLRRYAANSIKIGDALPCRFEDLKLGDHVKARGTRSEDGIRFTAEELIAGSFRTFAAMVVSVNPAEGTVQATDLATKKALTTSINADSIARRLSADVAQMLAMRIQGAKTSSSSGELQSAIEKLPHLSIADLKPGEAIILTCTSGDDTSRGLAITLLAGAELLLKPENGKPLDLGSWNLDLSGEAGAP